MVLNGRDERAGPRIAEGATGGRAAVVRTCWRTARLALAAGEAPDAGCSTALGSRGGGSEASSQLGPKVRA